jgi:hypothetical protein
MLQFGGYHSCFMDGKNQISAQRPAILTAIIIVFLSPSSWISGYDPILSHLYLYTIH